jgi:dolichol kinase
MAEEPKEPIQEKYSWFWTLFIIVVANLIIASALFVNTNYLWNTIGALAVINFLLVFFILIGKKRHEKVKDKDKSATTFSRKMFNIISGLLFAFFIAIFNPFVAFFILLGVDFAFGFHEVVYVKFKTKMYFTDAFIALGRQSEPFKPYLASIMALFGFSIVLGFQAFVFQAFSLPGFPISLIVIYIATILIWGIGDTAAYFAGTRLGKHHLPYNKKKSWEGFFGNLGVGTAIGLILFNPLVLPFVTPVWWIMLALCGGLAGAFFESVNLHLDDNFVAVTAMGLILGVLFLLV